MRHTQFHLHWSVILFVSLLSLVQCGDPSSRMVHWHYIIPDRYQGFLVIRYACPGGHPLSDDGSTIVVVFQNDGTYCTNASVFSWHGKVTAATRTGQSVSGQGLWDQRGYGFYSDGLLTVEGPPRQQFDVYWVGDLEYLASMRNKPAYGEQLSAFLKDRFEISVMR